MHRTGPAVSFASVERGSVPGAAGDRPYVMSHPTLDYQPGTAAAKQRWRTAARRWPFAAVPFISILLIGWGHVTPTHLKASWYGAIGFTGAAAIVSTTLGKAKLGGFLLAWAMLLCVFVPSLDRAT